MYVGGSEARCPRAPGQNSNIKGASSSCACRGWLEVPATPYLGRPGGYVVALGILMCSPEHQQRCAAQDCMP